MKAVWLMLLVAFQAADIVTTIMILKSGGRERNPFLRRLFKRLPVLPAILGAKLMLTTPAFYFVLAYPKLWWAPTAGCTVLAAVLVNNLRVLSKIKSKAP